MQPGAKVRINKRSSCTLPNTQEFLPLIKVRLLKTMLKWLKSKGEEDERFSHDQIQDTEPPVRPTSLEKMSSSATTPSHATTLSPIPPPRGDSSLVMERLSGRDSGMKPSEDVANTSGAHSDTSGGSRRKKHRVTFAPEGPQIHNVTVHIDSETYDQDIRWSESCPDMDDDEILVDDLPELSGPCTSSGLTISDVPTSSSRPPPPSYRHAVQQRKVREAAAAAAAVVAAATAQGDDSGVSLSSPASSASPCSWPTQRPSSAQANHRVPSPQPQQRELEVTEINSRLAVPRTAPSDSTTSDLDTSTASLSVDLPPRLPSRNTQLRINSSCSSTSADSAPLTFKHAYPTISNNANPKDLYANLQDSDAFITPGRKSPHLIKGQSILAYMPEPIVIKIFKFLPTDQLSQCMRVCRRWYNLAWDATLWQNLRINNEKLNVDKAVKVLTRRLSYDTPSACPMVERIDLSGSTRLTDKGLRLIGNRCPELRELNLSGCEGITDEALSEVVTNCVSLEVLNLTGCSCISTVALTAAERANLGPAHGQLYLKHLDMTDCQSLDDEGLHCLAYHCRGLTHLYLRRCTRVTDQGLQYLAHFCTSLKELSISDCPRITDFGLKELSKIGPSLKYLSVAKCDKISDVGIRYIANRCPKLRYLNVRGCEAVSDESLELLARNCNRLRSLDIGKCDVTDDGVTILAHNCPQIRKLSLKACDAVTDEAVFALAKYCHHLQQLNIQECHVTADAFRTVKKHCKKCIIEHTNPAFY